MELGIANIVAHAADVPTSDKERRQKEDTRDSRKLSRCLESGALEPVHVPDPHIEQPRSLCRLQERSRSHLTRLQLYGTGVFPVYRIEW